MKTYYTALVNHYFRMGVRYEKSYDPVSQRWIELVKDWLKGLSPEDRRYITVIFGGNSRRTYRPDEPRMYELEKQFAMVANLYDEEEV